MVGGGETAALPLWGGLVGAPSPQLSQPCSAPMGVRGTSGAPVVLGQPLTHTEPCRRAGSDIAPISAIISGHSAVARPPAASPCIALSAPFRVPMAHEAAGPGPTHRCCCFSSNFPSISEHRAAGAGALGAAARLTQALGQGEGPLSSSAAQELRKS